MPRSKTSRIGCSGKGSEKNSPLKTKKDGQEDPPSKRRRGQKPGSGEYGRTKRPGLPIVHDESNLADEEKSCPTCGLPHLPTPALDEHSEVIEVEVRQLCATFDTRPSSPPHPRRV